MEVSVKNFKVDFRSFFIFARSNEYGCLMHLWDYFCIKHFSLKCLVFEIFHQSDTF